MTSTPATLFLDSLGIPYRLFQHAGPVDSLEQAAAERGQRPQQVVRSILFRLAEDEYLMVLAAGPRQISWPALRRHLSQHRLTLRRKAAAPAGADRPQRAGKARDFARLRPARPGHRHAVTGPAAGLAQ